MPTNSNFNFTNNSVVTLELPFSEHVEELRQRIFLIVGIIFLFTCLAFVEVKSLVKILELPINNVKFFQLSPGEYFISTIKIAFYTGLLFSSPFAIGQLILFLLPGLTKKETKNYSSFINQFINFIWFRVSFFILHTSSSRTKFLFKL
jgi:sec-independent protein translocase protein TatC